MLFTGNAFAQTSTDVSASQSSDFHQTVDIPRDNVLAALALGADDADIWDIANIDRSWTFGREFERDVDIDEDDTLLLLALGNNGLGGSSLRRALVFDNVFGDDDFDFGFDDDFGLGFADVDERRVSERSLQQTVDLDDDDVLAALALGGGRFGNLDLWDIADIDRTSSRSLVFDRDIDLDDDDVLLWLALT